MNDADRADVSDINGIWYAPGSNAFYRLDAGVNPPSGRGLVRNASGEERTTRRMTHLSPPKPTTQHSVTADDDQQLPVREIATVITREGAA